MRRHRAIGFAAAAAMLGVVAGCDADLTEINRNPNNPEVVPVEAVLSSGIWDMASPSSGYAIFGEWTNLYHTTLWAQHVAQAAYVQEDNYKPRAQVNDNIWSNMYSGGLRDVKRAQEIAEANGDQNLVAVTEVLLVYGFLFLTDLFGDVPYFEALDLDATSTPAFTPQEEIYPDLLERLDAAAAQITPSTNVTWDDGDLIYGGDLDDWQKFANSLRLRIAMRTANTAFAPQAAQHFAEAWNANRFQSNADNADLDWTGTAPSQNPLFENLARSREFRVSKSLVDILAASNDPRLAVYADPAESDGAYRGLFNGSPPQQVAQYSNIGEAFLEADAPSVFLSYAEVLLLGAEAAARGWIGGDPATLYAAGIRASMAEHGIPSAAIDAYLAQPSVAYTGIADIQLQQWIAVFMAGPEAYAMVRRTGVPDLPLPAAAVIDRIPTRMPYPANEGLYNPNFEAYENVTYTDPLWWMSE